MVVEIIINILRLTPSSLVKCNSVTSDTKHNPSLPLNKNRLPHPKFSSVAESKLCCQTNSFEVCCYAEMTHFTFNALCYLFVPTHCCHRWGWRRWEAAWCCTSRFHLAGKFGSIDAPRSDHTPQSVAAVPGELWTQNTRSTLQCVQNPYQHINHRCNLCQNRTGDIQRVM